MPVWKVLLIGLLSFVSLILALATVAIPLAQTGVQRWVWLACLLPATITSGTLLTLFLRHAGTSLEFKSRWSRH